jgi:hypothetical protein
MGQTPLMVILVHVDIIVVGLCIVVTENVEKTHCENKS